jgi:hypothetical protein
MLDFPVFYGTANLCNALNDNVLLQMSEIQERVGFIIALMDKRLHITKPKT